MCMAMHANKHVGHTISDELSLAPYALMETSFCSWVLPGFIRASLSKIQGLFKDFLKLSYSFEGLKVYENPDFSVKTLF